MRLRPWITQPAGPDPRRSVFDRLRQSLAITFGVVRMLRPHAKGCGPEGFHTAVLSVVFVAAHLAQPWPIKWIIDGLAGQATPLNSSLLTLSAAYIVIAFTASLVNYTQRRSLADLSNRVICSFREALFTHLLRLPLAYQQQRGTGELLTRVVWDTARLRRGVSGVLLRMYQNTFLFVATVAVLFWISPLLASAVLGCGVLAFASMLTTNHRILGAARVARKREGQVASVVEEALRGARELQTFSRMRDRRFDAANERSRRGEQKLVRLEAGLLFRVELLLALSVCFILWRGTAAVSAGVLTVGDLILFVHYTVGLYRPFTQFARQASQAGRTSACAERLMKIVARKEAAADGPLVASVVRGELALEEVYVKARQRARSGRSWLLEGVSFRIAAGEHVGIMGPNGAGKSTLLRQILRLEDPASGRVLIDGRDVRDYTVESLRRQFSVVHQDATVFGLTVRENIALGKPEATDADMFEALRRSGAAEFVRAMPKGLDTIVRGARIFSTGERQRIALTRAILRGARIWLLDEPTAALDRAAEVEEALRSLLRGRTVLWVTHDLATAMRMDRILVLVDGQISFYGPPAELQALVASERTGQFLETLRA